jgi:hypothetical protein
MARFLNMMDVMCPSEEQDREFCRWYESIHLPDILETPGYVSGRRYVPKQWYPGRGGHITAYEIESEDIDRTMALRREKREKERAAGRYVDAFIPIWRDMVWKQIARVVPGKAEAGGDRWVHFVETFCRFPSREDEYNDWYTNVHVPDVQKTPGFGTAVRYKAHQGRDGRGAYLTVYEIRTTDIDRSMALRAEYKEKERVAGRGSDTWAPMWYVLAKLVTERSNG